MNNLLMILMNKGDSMQEQMSNISKDGDPRKEPKEMLEIKKNTVTDMKTVFDRL